MFANVVLDVDHHYFEEILENHKLDLGVHLDTELTAEQWRAVVADYKAKVEEVNGAPSRSSPRSSCGRRSAPSSAAG